MDIIRICISICIDQILFMSLLTVVDTSDIIKIRCDDIVGENKVFVVVGKEMNDSVFRWALSNLGGA